jgi:hypothetical protein
MKTDQYLKSAAEEIERQALENPGLGIPADPDVADHMGAFEEKAVAIGDFDPVDDEDKEAL